MSWVDLIVWTIVVLFAAIVIGGALLYLVVGVLVSIFDDMDPD